MAGLWKHPQSKNWYARFTDSTGRGNNRSTGTANRKKALKIAQTLDAHAELMTAVAGESQPFAVVGDDFGCHLVWVGCIRAMKKPVGEDGQRCCWTVG